MAGSDDTPATTELRRASKFYRRPLGLAWLIGVAVIPLLLGVIGYGVLDRSNNEPIGAVPTLSPSGAAQSAPTVPGLNLAPVSITRNGNEITLQGDFPDAAAKTALLDAVLAGVGQDVNVFDHLGVNPDVISLDFSDAEPVFHAAASVPNFSLSVSGDTITLTGTAATMDQEDAIEQAVEDAWPNLNIVDKMEISGPITPTGTPSSTPSPAVPGAGGPSGTCANLRSDISALLGGPITFATDGFSLTPSSEQKLTQVADKLKACPGMNVAINGYTDNTGSDAINIPLSANRADFVADFLIARGVTRDHLTTKGFGSADPIANNDTPDGRAKNRRVEIVVS